jgi:NADPH2:quinone reductase
MKAVLCKTLGPPERLELVSDWPMPEAAPGEVIIAVRAAGLNFPDTLIIEGKYQFQPELPFVPGGECAGVVHAVGAEVRGLQPGDKVVAHGLHGAFAQYMKLPAAAVHPLPEPLDFAQAAGVCVTYMTSLHALKQRANLRAGETMLVLGAAGGVGSAAVELGKAMGARVIAAVGDDAKVEFCKSLGADHVINYRRDSLKDVLKSLTGGRGVDVVYDPVGGDLAEPAVRAMAWNGRYLVVGFAAGEIPRIPLNLTLLKGCSLVGVFWGRFVAEQPAENAENNQQLWQWFAEGRLRPPAIQRFPVANYLDAFDCLRTRRAQGKVVLEF